MGVEFHEEIAPVGGGSKPSVGNARSARGQIHESITIDSSGPASAPVRDDAAAGVEHESITVGSSGRAGRLPESARKMLENIDKHGTVHDEAPAVSTPTSPIAAAAPTPAVPPAQAVTPSDSPAAAATSAPAATTTAPVKATEDAVAEHKARADRFHEANQKLVTEVEQLRARPTRGEPTPRELALDEAERTVIDDSIGALRKLYATALGVDDPKHASVDQHLTWLYHDLTERELGVPLDPAIKNARELERIKHLRARDKRDDAAAKAPVQQPANGAQFDNHVRLVGEHQTAAKHAEKFPLLMTVGQDFDRLAPSELVLREIQRGFETGEYHRATNDDVLIESASRRLEDKYQVLAEKIGKARPQQAASTATPTQAAVATDPKAEPQGNGHRTITNASASVAPATPPATKPAPDAATTAKPWRNEKERIKQLIAKHSGEPVR